MQFSSEARILDITEHSEYEKHLYRCLGGPPSRRNQKRIAYLEKAIPGGFRKKLLVVEGDIIGTIEYAPPAVSYYPIIGDNMTVMNCIWVLRRVRGHAFGRMLVNDMVESNKNAVGFATVALTGHWSPWFRKQQMEKLGFEPLESMSVTHKVKHEGNAFSIHLMWMPTTKDAQHPSWYRQKLLKGITACTAHPLYHPQSYEPKQIFREYL